jgi:endonuclease YncB( thermonuclease family)
MSWKKIFHCGGCIPSYIRNTEFVCDYNETIPFVPPIQSGYVIKVYDGDTITIASKLPYKQSPLFRFQVRLNGIDCPEMKSKNEEEKFVAKIAQNELENLILHKHVHLKNISVEKYGRILADVYLDDFQLNKHMLDKRLAVVYSGSNKLSPKNWKNYYTTGEYE